MTWVLADAVDLPFKSDSFDFVISANALRHRERMELAYREVHRIPRPGGEAVLKVRDARLLDRPVEAAFRVAFRETLLKLDGAIEGMYRPASLEQAVATARAVGFRIDHVSSLRIDREANVDEAVRRFRIVAGYMFAAVDDVDRTRLVGRLRELLESSAWGGFVPNHGTHGALVLRV